MIGNSLCGRICQSPPLLRLPEPGKMIAVGKSLKTVPVAQGRLQQGRLCNIRIRN
jgi:hypothetical protein